MTFKYGNSEFEIIDGRVCLVLKPSSHFGGLTIEQLLQVVEENFSEISHTHVINDIVASASQSVFCLTTTIADGSTADFTIPEDTGGLVLIIEDGGDGYASLVFNNDSGMLVGTELIDSGGIASSVGTSLRVTNSTGGSATYYLTFIGRNVSDIEEV